MVMKGFILRLFFLIQIITLSVLTAQADYYKDYIEKYAEMAVMEQKSTGIPASITLAQGLLESAAGRSRLATEGNNHFGIKCHADWKGETMIASDDRPDDCFRVYSNPAESFSDHSAFLSRKRYQPLFDIPVADYAGWARGLKQCGYATDPNYADRLITIIERYSLYIYDGASGVMAEETAEFIKSHLMSSHHVRRSRGLHYVIAVPGDTYASIAKEFKLDKKRLMQINDVDRDGTIKDWQEVYLEPKKTTAPEGISSVTIGETESLHSIAQRFGMTVESILLLNPKLKDRPGSRIKLR